MFARIANVFILLLLLLADSYELSAAQVGNFAAIPELFEQGLPFTFSACLCFNF